VFGRFAFYYVPDGRVVVQPGEGAQVTTWLHPSPRLAVLLADLASRLKPYPMPELTEVAVNGRPAADPESYLKLYAVGKKATTYPSEMGTQVSLQTDRRTPWSDGNDVVVPSDMASRKHARVYRGEKGHYIEDLGSANGSYINGVRVDNKKTLKLGDQIRIGRSLMVFGAQPGVSRAAE